MIWPLLGLASRQRGDWILPFGVGLVLGLALTPQGRNVSKRVVNISESAVKSVVEAFKPTEERDAPADAADQETA